MSALTVRLPDDQHQRLHALAEFDAETRFKLRAEWGAGKAERVLALLDKARQQRGKE